MEKVVFLNSYVYDQTILHYIALKCIVLKSLVLSRIQLICIVLRYAKLCVSQPWRFLPCRCTPFHILICNDLNHSTWCCVTWPIIPNDLTSFHPTSSRTTSPHPTSSHPTSCRTTSPYLTLLCMSCRWISTHYRMKQYYWDESIEMVKAYNEGMRQFFDSGSCADVNYIDVYNMTQRLGVGNPQEVSEEYRGPWTLDPEPYYSDDSTLHWPEEHDSAICIILHSCWSVYLWSSPLNTSHCVIHISYQHLTNVCITQGTNLTYDQVHWGMEVNLWKAQNILNAILR